MKPPFLGLSSTGAVVAALALVGCGKPATQPGTARVAAGGVTLTSVAVELPADEGHYPAGAHATLVDANCTGCHSAAMALTQPPLTVAQWQAEVSKMREVYHAPVADRDVAAIVAYLSAMPGQRRER